MEDSIKMNVKDVRVQGWRIDSNGSGSCEHRNELSGFTKIQGSAKRTHVFQIIVTLFIFNIKKLCQHQNNL